MRDSNPTRLLILGLLATGPMHGHQIRHSAELGDIERWGGVKVGSLYGMLHRLELEGLIEEARSEQEGRRPARTV
ncbi:MAG: PadR family transcriptional regulator, partial [Gaiellaceae bacterium]